MSEALFDISGGKGGKDLVVTRKGVADLDEGRVESVEPEGVSGICSDECGSMEAIAEELVRDRSEFGRMTHCERRSRK